MKPDTFKGCPPWFKKKGYPHFDGKIRSRAAARKWVARIQDPAAIAKHAFLPFIRNEVVVHRRKPDEKGDHKKRRPIMYASHVDANVYGYYATVLNARYEHVIGRMAAGPSVLAYRRFGRGANNVSFSRAAFAEIRDRGACVALAFDVKSFFDTLDHGLLHERWCRVLGVGRLPLDHLQVFRSLTRYSFVDRAALCGALGISARAEKDLDRYVDAPAAFRTKVRDAGLIQPNPGGTMEIPQGSPMSAVLSNVYMLDADERMHAFLNALGASYRRYCDDILVICAPEHRQAALDFVSAELARMKLQVNAKKTEIAAFEVAADGRLRLVDGCRPLQYLGFTFDGERILLRSPSLARYYRKMKAGVRAAARAANRNPHGAMPRKLLYRRYTHLGGRNFVSYAQGARDVMASPHIRQQVSRHWKKLHDEINGR